MNLTLSLFFVFLSEPMSMKKPIPISVANLELSRHFFSSVIKMTRRVIKEGSRVSSLSLSHSLSGSEFLSARFGSLSLVSGES